jgi:hypothetical protein
MRILRKSAMVVAQIARGVRDNVRVLAGPDEVAY